MHVRGLGVAILVATLAPSALARPSLQISATTDAPSDRALHTRLPVLQACFTKERNRNTSLGEHVSTVVLHISVDKGRAHVPVFDEDKSVKDDDVKSCVAFTIVRLRFPKTAELDYTLTYTP